MTPAEFASFRSFLANASGFQSAQFRELEFMLGVKDRIQIEWFSGDERERLERRFESPTLWDAFLHGLERAGVAIPTEVLEYFIALGLNVQEVWGMSELSAVATMRMEHDGMLEGALLLRRRVRCVREGVREGVRVAARLRVRGARAGRVRPGQRRG